MFKKPFEEILSTKNLIDIDNVKTKISNQNITELVTNIQNRNDYRIFPIKQIDLLNDGWEYPENYDKKRFIQGKYAGNKWASKYLRAPDIFYTILAKGKGKFIELGKIADVKFGVKTGANDFFYLDKELVEKWQIEKTYLETAIKSPRECKSIIIKSDFLKYRIFICNKEKSQLFGTNALKYIEWGESAKVKIKRGSDKGKMIIGYQNISSVKNRNPWYSLGSLKSKYIIRSTFNDEFSIFLNKDRVIIDKVMYGIEPTTNDKNFKIGIYLNSTINALIINTFGQIGLGEGALFVTVETVKRFPFYLLENSNIELFKQISYRKSYDIFTECGINPSRIIRDQKPNPLSDRAALDKLIFDEIGLNEDERNEVYWSVCELVRERIDKAKSVKK